MDFRSTDDDLCVCPLHIYIPY